MARLPTLAPMRAVTAPHVPGDDGWAFEVKWDGMRIITAVDGAVRLASGNAIDVTVRFPELAGLADHLGGHRAVLDGEAVAIDDRGRTSFGRLQRRMHLSDASKVAEVRREVAVTYVVFDLLHLDDHSLLDVPYRDRRRLLLDLVEPSGSWLVPTHQEGDGAALFAATRELGLEGIMAKRLDSPYLPGKRSPAWRKVKVRRRQEVVIGGWNPGEGGRSGALGALLVGVRDADRSGSPLRFAGGVGTGFTAASLADLQGRLEPLATPICPFDPRPPTAVTRRAHWVEPVLVAEVEFGEWTGEDRLRHPSYLGLRMDKDPTDVVREPDPGGPGPEAPDARGR